MSPTYQPLPRSPSSVGGTMDDHEDAEPHAKSDGASAHLQKRLLAANIALLLLNIFGIIIALSLAGLGRAVSGSPIYPPLKEFETKHVEHWDMSIGTESVYTDTAGPEADAAWGAITSGPGEMGVTEVDRSFLQNLGLNSISVVERDKGVVGVNVFHQLHCLDLIRKALRPGVYPAEKQMHTDHCINTLRRGLQCNPDLSLITFVQPPNVTVPRPDFHTVHECMDWDGLVEWMKRNKLKTKSE